MPRFALVAMTVATLAGAAYVTPAAAVVYCKSAGAPKGCVARPTAPATRAAVHCTRPGYPAGCVPGAGAPGVGVAPGPGVAPANAGGPVNRIGVR
ncbi:hypothetical protein V5F38_03695 [Xanthobacter sp. V0B-10]|uniref:hypothetical protein n=1 Tax=Xanthobacter albus TaxID=3119929 RepID=UPI0037267889